MFSIITFNRCLLYLFIFIALLKINVVSGQSDPEFLSSPVDEATYGSFYQYNISVYDEDGDNLGVVLKSGNLPEGIILDREDGDYILAGIPNESGDFSITLEVFKRKDPSYNEEQSFTLEVNKANLYVTADDINISYGDAIPPLTITYVGFVNGDDEADLITAPTASTDAIVGSDEGDYDIEVSGGESNDYEFEYNDGNLNIAIGNQTITFVEILDKTYGDADFALSASSDSGLPVSFIVTVGPASVSGNMLRIIGAGAVTVEARQAGNDNYGSAAAVSRSFEVTRATLAVTADDKNITYGDAIPPLTISYAGFVNNDNVGDLITAPTASTTANSNSEEGNYLINVSGGVSNDYQFTYISGNLNISNVNQTITFAEIPDKTYGDADFALSASSDSGLPVSFIVTVGSATVSGNMVSIDGAGAVTVEARQAGNNNYEPAAAVSRSFEVTKATLAVTADDKNITYGDAIPPLTISYAGFVNNDGVADLITAPTASTAANSNSEEGDYIINVSGGVSNDYEFTYISGNLNITNGNQTITFAEIPDKTYGDADFALSASSDSGLPVSFAVIAGPATVSGNMLSIQGAGAVRVEARQAGNNNYEPATPVIRSFEVFKAEASIQIANTLQNYDGSPKDVTIRTQPEGLNFTITYNGNSNAPSNPGNYTVEVKIVEANYSGQLISTLAINSAPTSNGIPSQQIAENSNPIQLDLLNYFNDTEDDDTQLTFVITNNSNPLLFSQIQLTKNILKLSFNLNVFGSCNLTIRCTDSNGLYVEDQFEVEIIQAERAPFFTSEPLTDVLQDKEYQYFITAEDENAEDKLSISNIISLPNWLTLSDKGDGTAILSGIPRNGHVGVYGIALRVRDDNGNTDEQFFDIEVIDVNDLPVFMSSPITTAVVNVAYTYNIITNDIDVDDQVTLSVLNKPSWLSLETNGFPKGNGRLKGTPKVSDRNQEQFVSLQAKDTRQGITIQSFTIEIDFPNNAPKFISNPLTKIKQGENYRYEIIVEDIDNDAVTVKALVLPSWLSFSDESTNPILSGVPGNDAVGSHNVLLEAMDFIGLKTLQNFTITVENVNDPPVITSTPILAAIQNIPYEYRIEVEDIDVEDMVTISILRKPDWLEFSGQSILRGIPDFEAVQNSPHLVEIVATDQEGASDVQSFEITVRTENQPPTVDAIANPEAILEDTLDELVIPLTGISDGGEMNQTITVSINTDYPNMFEYLAVDYTSPETSGSIRYKILPDSFGIANVTIRFEDDGPEIINSVTINFQIKVIPVNDAPAFISTPIERVQPDDFYSYQIETRDADPNDKLTIKLLSGPEWLAFSDHQNGTARLQGMVPNNATNENVSIQVKDLSGATAEQSYLLQINEPPVISNFIVQMQEDIPYQFAKSDFEEAFSDNNADAIDQLILVWNRGVIQLNGNNINSGDEIDFQSNPNIQYIPPPNFFGEITLQWSASDGLVYANQATILMKIDSVNDAPILSNIEASVVEYIQGASPVVLTETITVSDIADELMNAAFVQIIENYNQAEDRLELPINNSQDISISYDTNTGILNLTGDATKSDYELALRGITYQNNNSRTVDTAPKLISFEISDAQLLSDKVFTTLQITNLLPELDIVNAFTPDGNAVNDTWDFINLDAFEQVNISVYNNQGINIYNCITNNCEWGGTFQGEALPAGTYFYLINLNNGRRKYEGTVTILK